MEGREARENEEFLKAERRMNLEMDCIEEKENLFVCWLFNWSIWIFFCLIFSDIFDLIWLFFVENAKINQKILIKAIWNRLREIRDTLSFFEKDPQIN